MQGIKWGGLLLRRGAAHTAGASARRTEDLRACKGRAITTDLLGLSVVIKLAHPMSRHGFLLSQQGIGQLGLLVSRHDLLCRDNGASVRS